MLKYDGSLTGQRLEEEKPGEKQGQTVHKTAIKRQADKETMI